MNRGAGNDLPEPKSYVLVVDDDPAILTTVSEILQFEGYAVRTATNGAEALRLVEHARPWLILLDMRMPVMDGWGFARALRARHRRADRGDDCCCRFPALGGGDRGRRPCGQAVRAARPRRRGRAPAGQLTCPAGRVRAGGGRVGAGPGKQQHAAGLRERFAQHKQFEQ